MWQVFSGVIWQPGAAAALSYSAYSSSEAYTGEERVMVEIVEGEGKSVPALSAASYHAGGHAPGGSPAHGGGYSAIGRYAWAHQEVESVEKVSWVRKKPCGVL